MAYTVILHLTGDVPVMGEIDELPKPTDTILVVSNPRQRDGKDLALDFNKEKFARYKDVAPDCQGQWMVFWRQCMPGLDNKCVDDEGKPMKNWWPFLFY